MPKPPLLFQIMKFQSLFAPLSKVLVLSSTISVWMTDTLLMGVHELKMHLGS